MTLSIIRTIIVSLTTVTMVTSANDQKWIKDYLMSTEALLEKITDSIKPTTIVFNTGPVENILGAVYIGPVEQEKYLEIFKTKVAVLNKNQEIVIYCGCCPLQVCPNLKPAFDYLKQIGFRNAKVLDLPNGLDEDWIAKGYPIE